MSAENSPAADISVGRIPRLQTLDQNRCHIQFVVSLNEEHVTLTLSAGQQLINLGERTHHYSLLLLARQRLHDARRGLDPSSQGWIEAERLAHSLGIDASHLNIHIFRARNQFKQAFAGLESPLDIIERRRCEVRFAALSFQIVRGSHVEGDYVSLASASSLTHSAQRSELRLRDFAADGCQEA